MIGTLRAAAYGIISEYAGRSAQKFPEDIKMSLDLKYLLFLQGIRAVTGGIFDEIFNGLSKFAVDILPFLPFVVFRCADKKWDTASWR